MLIVECLVMVAMAVVVLVMINHLWIGSLSMDDVAVHGRNVPSMDGATIGREIVVMRCMGTAVGVPSIYG